MTGRAKRSSGLGCSASALSTLLTLLTASLAPHYLERMPAPTASDLATARFMRTLSAAALELARELESTVPGAESPPIKFEDTGLGTLQQAVARVLADADAAVGISPREIANAMDRSDEPNVRSALNRLAERGVAERIPDLPTQRWRLTAPYRQGGDPE